MSYNCEHSNIDSTLKDFKYSVLKPVKFYNKVKTLPEYSNISYSQFKARNVSFDIFEAAFLRVSNDTVINDSQLEHIFEYLINNIKVSSDTNIKKIVKRIKKLRIELVQRLGNLDPEADKIAIKNINTIIEKLEMLKTVMIDTLKSKNAQVENEIDFDILMDDLLNPNDLSTSNLLSTLFYNLPVFGNSKSNSRKFNERIYRAILSAMHRNNNELKKYYICLANYIHQTNIYLLDRRVMNICGFNAYNKNAPTKLKEKISKLEFDHKRARYRINDFIVTIDNESTSKYDDAISIEKMPDDSYILGIHIADVYSLGISPATRESIEYRSRASLCENVDKNAISLFVEISNTGLIIDKKILMTTINVNNNLLYDDVSKILSYKGNDKLCQTIVDLIGLYNIVDNSKLPDFPGPSTIAHALVQKYMLLYGCVVSGIASENKYPILYQTGSDKKSEVTLNEVHVNTGFDDNGLNTYARFTSPIWDVRSFINQNSICRCIFDRIDWKEKNDLRLQLSGFKNKINKELRLRIKNSTNDRDSLQE